MIVTRSDDNSLQVYIPAKQASSQHLQFRRFESGAWQPWKIFTAIQLLPQTQPSKAELRIPPSAHQQDISKTNASRERPEVTLTHLNGLLRDGRYNELESVLSDIVRGETISSRISPKLASVFIANLQKVRSSGIASTPGN